MPINFSTFLSKITKYNRVPLGFDPSVARLLGHDPTPRLTYPVSKMEVKTFKYMSLNEWCKAGRLPVSYAIDVVPDWIDTEAKA